MASIWQKWSMPSLKPSLAATARGPPVVAVSVVDATPVDASCGGAARAERDNANAKIMHIAPPPP